MLLFVASMPTTGCMFFMASMPHLKYCPKLLVTRVVRWHIRSELGSVSLGACEVLPKDSVVDLGGLVGVVSPHCAPPTSGFDPLLSLARRMLGPTHIRKASLLSQPYPLKVASKLHQYDELEGPAVASSRSSYAPREAFRANPKSASLPFRSITKSGADLEWYSPGADRHPVSHGDLQMAAESCATHIFDDRIVACAWKGAIVDWSHMMALRAIGESQWYIGLVHLPGSSVVLWPVTLKECPGGEGMEYFMPNAGVSMPTLRCLTDFARWEAATFTPRSPCWLHRELAKSSAMWSFPAVRFIRRSEVAPLLKVAAQSAFWSLGKPWLRQVAAELGLAVSDGTTMMDLVWTLVRSITGSDEEIVADLVEKRVAEMHRQVESNDAGYAHVEELHDCLEVRDEEEVEKKVSEWQEDQAELKQVIAEFSDKVKTLPNRRRSGKLVNNAGKRYPRALPRGQIPRDVAKALSPPGSYLWRARTDGRWCGRLPPYGELSRSWAKFGEQEALRLVLQQMWRLFLARTGRHESDCPIGDLFETSDTT